MQNPNAVSDTNGEYFEVYNTTGSDIDMNGWVISDAGSESHAIASSVVVPANGYAVLGRNADNMANGGLTLNYEYANIFLGNSDDEVILSKILTVPHPKMLERKFVLIPLAEIAGNIYHPIEKNVHDNQYVDVYKLSQYLASIFFIHKLSTGFE